MIWQPEIDELKHRHGLAEQMGGPEGIARQHARGKLTVRERIALLADPGSFQELGKLAGIATYRDDQLTEFIPRNRIAGFCTINGRKVFLDGGDFTIRGGAGQGEAHGPQPGVPTALEWRLPCIHLLDAAGGSVKTFEQIGRTYIPDNPGWIHSVELLNVVPVVAAALGSVAGAPAVAVCLSHFSVMVKGTSQIFPGGPPVVKASLGYDISKEDLGDYRIHTRISGVCDNVAESEQEAFEIVKKFLSYMPDSVWETPPRVSSGDPVNRREERLLSIIPRSSRRGYDAYKILEWVLDKRSFFETSPDYGGSRITGLGRLDGYPVGVMINNPMRLGGAMDVAAGNKVIRFLQLCDTFHLPVVCLVDEPGFLVGTESEKQGIERAGARLVCVTNTTRVPWISIIIRQSYGVAGSLQLRSGGMFRRFAWPSANWGSMHIEGGTTAAYRREIDTSPDPEAKRIEIEKRLKAVASPFRTAEQSGVDIIDPRDTRPLLCDFVTSAQKILQTQLGPGTGPTFYP